MLNQVFAALRRVPFFSELPDEILRVLAQQASVKTYPKHTVLINEGDTGGPFHIILEGKVRIYLCNESGREVILGYESAGQYFGELALLDDKPRSASVVTVEKTTCGLIAKEDFIEWLSNHPVASLSIIRGLSERVRTLTDKVKRLALSSVQGRILYALTTLAVHRDGKMIVPRRPTQQELADMVGASREMVNRILQELIKDEYFLIDGKKLIFNKPLPTVR